MSTREERDLLLPWIEDLPAYVPGRPANAASGLVPVKLSSNENPYAPLPSVLEAAIATLQDANRYPDPQATELVHTLAGLCGVAPDNIAVGPGSVALLQQLAQVTSSVGDEVLFAWRSFEAYPLVTVLNGATPVPVPLNNHEEHDLEEMARRISDRTSLILLCTPNNPTGAALTTAAFHRFMRSVPASVLVVIDEAYAEFVRGSHFLDGLREWHAYPNVAVLRTFSKAYGLAGLRLGHVIGHPELISGLRRSTVPFAVPSVTQAAAIESLRRRPELIARVEAIVRERSRVLRTLADLGLSVEPSQANFVWIRWGARHQEFLDACRAAALAVRPYGDEGVRVTIGEPEENDRFLRVVSDVVASPASA
jgi:histidinol-phosphate aminotransferase